MKKQARHTKKTHLGLFGNVAIPRAYCKNCETRSFIIDGHFRCCDQSFEQEIKDYVIECEPEKRRRLPPATARKAKLESQEDRCFYCRREFGSYVVRDLKHKRLLIAWDHYVPYSYSQDNRESNFVAACQICNGMKSAKIFQTVEEAKVYLHLKWKEKGYI